MTDLTMAGTSKGLMDLKLITSAVRPYSSFNCLAACKQNVKFLEWETRVISLPSNSILALPKGTVKSGCWASGDNSKDSPYSSSFSKNTTGFGSLMEALIKPLWSSEDTVWTSEGDVTWLDTTRHVVGLSGRVDDVIDGLHGEVEGHELDNWLQTSQGGTGG
ncbi:hypothetical protein WICPIJ_000434 [Wickerhamomyces pijperi]|uniref:Uncharacterized protein n=1 Tax=Wickerhamomyces pijperi TaxID=599730 RepID=A0A9P8QGE1_WICPI|nr:hypothetical protein WICPIJ_000434 [Wickerhamomyces pijperi]